MCCPEVHETGCLQGGQVILRRSPQVSYTDKLQLGTQYLRMFVVIGWHYENDRIIPSIGESGTQMLGKSFQMGAAANYGPMTLLAEQ
jgi:hypothetical protein